MVKAVVRNLSPRARYTGLSPSQQRWVEWGGVSRLQGPPLQIKKHSPGTGETEQCTGPCFCLPEPLVPSPAPRGSQSDLQALSWESPLSTGCDPLSHPPRKRGRLRGRCHDHSHWAASDGRTGGKNDTGGSRVRKAGKIQPGTQPGSAICKARGLSSVSPALTQPVTNTFLLRSRRSCPWSPGCYPFCIPWQCTGVFLYPSLSWWEATGILKSSFQRRTLFRGSAVESDPGLLTSRQSLADIYVTSRYCVPGMALAFRISTIVKKADAGGLRQGDSRQGAVLKGP